MGHHDGRSRVLLPALSARSRPLAPVAVAEATQLSVGTHSDIHACPGVFAVLRALRNVARACVSEREPRWCQPSSFQSGFGESRCLCCQLVLLDAVGFETNKKMVLRLPPDASEWRPEWSHGMWRLCRLFDFFRIQLLMSAWKLASSATVRLREPRPSADEAGALVSRPLRMVPGDKSP